ncbi:helix-turn-helix transcriptional regulator [Salmonella enterica]|nr:helix-turn-helix transcriptional regulator [Salmonella enterica]EIH1698943.1 helix-turn-helix transcriptional regulator [Salmonella enterica]EIK5378181.1 helix-turn-helix transcriptional regulator [Salmonella enterica]EIW3133750.1 helix-turn-helix transcriptional regulator [Salmonella enterica]EJR9119728.1 helix-turn-helix transcriptional regulator [Salmonella enterica]
MSKKIHIGDRLREERERLGLSQDELAATASITRKTLYNYENGVRSPDAEALAVWNELGMDVYYVVTGMRLNNKESPYGTVNNADEAEMLAEYREGDDDARDVARYTLAKAAARKREAS